MWHDVDNECLRRNHNHTTMTTIELDRAHLINCFKANRGMLSNEQIISNQLIDALDDLLRDESLPHLSADWDEETTWHLTVFGHRVSDTYPKTTSS